MIGSKGRGGLFDAAMKDAGPAGVYVVVDDVDAHHQRAVEHGVEILMPPTDQDYGSRDYMARDAEGTSGASGRTPPRSASEPLPAAHPPVCTWNAARRTALASAGSGWGGGERDQDLHGARVADGADLVQQLGHGGLHRGLQVPDQHRRLAVVGDGGGGVHPQPGGLLPGEHLVGVLRVDAVVLGEPAARTAAGPAHRRRPVRRVRRGRADDAQRPRRPGSAARASSPRAAPISSVTALPTGRAASQARYSARAALGRELGAAAEHVLGGLLDVAGGALRGHARSAPA